MFSILLFFGIVLEFSEEQFFGVKVTQKEDVTTPHDRQVLNTWTFDVKYKLLRFKKKN